MFVWELTDAVDRSKSGSLTRLKPQFREIFARAKQKLKLKEKMVIDQYYAACKDHLQLAFDEVVQEAVKRLRQDFLQQSHIVKLQLNVCERRLTTKRYDLVANLSLPFFFSSEHVKPEKGPQLAEAAKRIPWIYKNPVLDKIACCRIFCPNLLFESDYLRYNFGSAIKSFSKDGSTFNRIVKSLAGLVSAWVLSYLVYVYLKFNVHYDIYESMNIVSVIFIILSLGLTLENRPFRAVVLLTLPLLSSNRGKSFLYLNMLSICLTTIVPNFMRNIQLLQLALACNMDLIQHQFQDLFNQDERMLELLKIIADTKRLCDRIKHVFKTIKMFLRKITDFLAKVTQVLETVSSVCSNVVGKPQWMCEKFVNLYVEDCEGKRSNIFRKLKCSFFSLWYQSCSVLSGLQYACLAVKYVMSKLFGLFMLMLPDSWSLYIDTKLDALTNEFVFEVTYVRNSTVQIVQEKKFSAIALEIAKIYEQRLEKVFEGLSLFQLLFPVSFILVIFGAVRYYVKYMKFDSFENWIIGARFREIDYQRRVRGLKGLLPLKGPLANKYIHLFDFSMTHQEIFRTVLSLLVLLVMLLPIGAILFIDKTAISVNKFLVKSAHFEVNAKSPETMKVNVEGNAFMVPIYRKLFSIFESSAQQNLTMSNSHCLPHPNEVDPSVYELIFTYSIVLTALSVFQAYFKRWRCICVGSVYPERDRERSVWLYHKIQSEKSSTCRPYFLAKFDNRYSNSTLIRTIRAVRYPLELLLSLPRFAFKLAFLPISMLFFGSFPALSVTDCFYKLFIGFTRLRGKIFHQDGCHKCGLSPEACPSRLSLIHCNNGSCKAVYCEECFLESGTWCQSCNQTIVLDGVATETIDLERDSSDDEAPEAPPMRRKRIPFITCELLDEAMKRFDRRPVEFILRGTSTGQEVKKFSLQPLDYAKTIKTLTVGFHILYMRLERQSPNWRDSVGQLETDPRVGHLGLVEKVFKQCFRSLVDNIDLDEIDHHQVRTQVLGNKLKQQGLVRDL